MNQEYFKILKEINSLEQNISTLETTNNNETARVSKLQDRRQLAQEELEQYKASLKDRRLLAQKNENELSSTDSKLAKIKADIGGSFDSKEMELLDREKQKLSIQLDELESAGFELLEQMEELEQLIKDKQTFIQGVGETIDEIQQEVDQLVNENQKQINSYQSRIDSSLTQLPENFVNTYQKLKTKNLSVSLFTKIQAGKCFVCKMGVDKTREAQVEDQLQLKTCSSCGRIFIPNQALF
ncbi:MAG: hypothetical protein KC478_15325 [Bacteriovoracaceae bacterium]|nr:hypothetical protein [Bacteriovoracaceae bacterium]